MCVKTVKSGKRLCYPRNYEGDKLIGGSEFYGCPEDTCAAPPRATARVIAVPCARRRARASRALVLRRYSGTPLHIVVCHTHPLLPPCLAQLPHVALAALCACNVAGDVLLVRAVSACVCVCVGGWVCSSFGWGEADTVAAAPQRCERARHSTRTCTCVRHTSHDRKDVWHRQFGGLLACEESTGKAEGLCNDWKWKRSRRVIVGGNLGASNWRVEGLVDGGTLGRSAGAGA
eukprot:2008618-Prymnesium_polylepis.1